MYLLINEVKHSVTKRTKTSDTIEYWGVTPAPEEISGTAQLFSDDDFLLCEDNLDNYERKYHKGTLLVATNKPEETPIDPTTTPEYRLLVLENENKLLNERLAETDEVAIDLYEASLANEAINAEQDEAIIEIYETMEGLING